MNVICDHVEINHFRVESKSQTSWFVLKEPPNRDRYTHYICDGELRMLKLIQISQIYHKLSSKQGNKR